MNWIDWLVVIASIGFIAGYGIWHTRRVGSATEFLKGGDNRWWSVGLSVMATQASAITFLSAPGLGYESGLKFAQFYFGLPLAVWFISRFFIDEYYRSRVITAYEYLERIFDLRVRLFTAFLFLLQRGMAAGITIYAPAIVLCVLFGWDLTFTCIVIGLVVIAYTVSGGTRAVSVTHRWQMGVIFLSLFIVFGILIYRIAQQADIGTLWMAARLTGRLDVLDWHFDLSTRYTVWSGLLGGFFLSLSYFGTDQSQVQRYLAGTDVRIARRGLYFNALLKIPMQLFILLTGVVVWMYFLSEGQPLVFNPSLRSEIAQISNPKFKQLHSEFDACQSSLKSLLSRKSSKTSPGEVSLLAGELHSIRQQYLQAYTWSTGKEPPKDTNFIFLHFVVYHLPHGLIGLVIVMVLSAAMSSTAGELNALATTTMVDYLGRLGWVRHDSRWNLPLTRLVTLLWGLLAIGFSIAASLFDNLIEMVNIIGSLFYGTILGIFLVAFFIRNTNSGFLLGSAIVTQSGILAIHFTKNHLPWLQIEYLWYNLLAAVCLLLANLLKAYSSAARNSDRKTSE
ncbi:MAG: sodium:solute symporter [Thermaurantimonas sp.]|uniref:sodium:solute symporter n=1 Tax=Thermaurantimonas sp. TaxID=2681568 RepID=UPI00391D901C